jgi:UDP-GlcNAc:undecaprenyl-phosphate/decaprenyl-phosphate GlcNAc-1-phosphate transferase
MLNNFLDTLSLVRNPLITLVITLFVLSFHWTSIFKFFNLKSYSGIQRVHKNEIARLGGFIIYSFLWVFWFFGYVREEIFFNILASAIPFVLVSLKEDLFHNTSPKIRLISMIISCMVFFHVNPIEFPAIDFPFINQFISLYPFNIIFFTFSILVVMNGMNLIDGMNGLFGLTSLIQLFCIMIISYKLNDLILVNISALLSVPLIIFLFFNFPLGKIFIGDLGAYFYGFANSVLTIYLFGKYDNLFTWLAVLILFYPCIELLFSYVRKISCQQSPLQPDNKHLHTLINKKLSGSIESSRLRNNVTTLILFIFWLSPIIFCIFVPVNFYIIFFHIGLILMIYFIAYFMFYNNDY